jgi:hypothetical protein
MNTLSEVFIRASVVAIAAHVHRCAALQRGNLGVKGESLVMWADRWQKCSGEPGIGAKMRVKSSRMVSIWRHRATRSYLARELPKWRDEVADASTEKSSSI